MSHEKSDVDRRIDELLSGCLMTESDSSEVMLQSTKVKVGMILDGIYRIDSLIGQGGMGSVYEAFNLTLERRVAIKVIKSVFSSNPEFLKRFRQEAVTMAKVNHPNVVHIHHCEVRNDGASYIVMEYVEGETLDDLLKREGHLPFSVASRLCRQILRALHAMHREGVIHRDLKPANIMLTRDVGRYRVRICDFGLGKLLDESDAGHARTELTEVGAVLGTPNYMSPEQCLGRKVSEASDIYSVGIVLFEMLSGHPPFRGGSKDSTIMRHLTVPPPLDALPKAVPRGARLVLAKALSKNALKRYRGAVSMLRALDTVKEFKAKKHFPMRVVVLSLVTVIGLGLGVYFRFEFGKTEIVEVAISAKGEVGHAVPRSRPLKFAPSQKPTRYVLREPVEKVVVRKKVSETSAISKKWPRSPEKLLRLAETYGDSGNRARQSEALTRFLRACKKRRSATCSRANRGFARARLKSR